MILVLDALFDALFGIENATKLLLVAVSVAAAGAYLLHRRRQGKDLPPGPAGLPLLGRLPWIDTKNLHLSMLRECEKYGGDICSFYIGSRLFIVVNSYPILHEMLSDRQFSGRPQLRFLQKLTRGCGIIAQEGESCSFQRRLSLKTLRDFGFARAETIAMIDDQLDRIFLSLDRQGISENQETLLGTFQLASNSIITEMTLGRRFEPEDSEFKKVNGYLTKMFTSSILLSPPLLFPLAEWLIDLIPMSSERLTMSFYVQSFIKNEINKREQLIMEGCPEANCLCDVYLREKRIAESGGDMETFKEYQLIRVCFEFYLAGTDTTARSMEWLLLYMAFYPEIQDRVHTEIDEVVGHSRRPKMQDRTELHYTCAVIDESYRRASLVATGLFHRAMKTTIFQGYKIPSDAIIIPLVYGIHHRSDYWEKPNEFYPEHFLDDKGHYRSSPYLLPFLIGRRSCVGESLARMEIFLFFTAIMQRYRVRPSPESQAKKKEILTGYLGTVRLPGSYRLNFIKR